MSTSAAKALASPPANPTNAAVPTASSSFFALSRFIGDEVKGSNKPPLHETPSVTAAGVSLFQGLPWPYVVLDDDLSLHGLPPDLKSRCVLTKPLLGLDAAATQRALHILRNHAAAPTIL